MKNFFKLFSVAVALMFSCTACVASTMGPIVRYVDSYDQLTNLRGSEYLYFVRDAGNVQHGDPTVGEGWALYSWDTVAADWKLLSKQEILSLNLTLPALVTKEYYNNDIRPVKNSIEANRVAIDLVKGDVLIVRDEVTGQKTQISLITNKLQTVDAEIEAAGKLVRDVREELVLQTNSVAQAKQVAKEAKDLAQSHEDRFDGIDEKIAAAKTAANGYTDQKVAETKIDLITNTAVRVKAAYDNAVATSKAYTDSKVAGVYHFKGKCLFDDLPMTGQENADAWFVTDKNATYVWIAADSKWTSLGSSIDLSAYKTWAEAEPIIDEKVAIVADSVTAVQGTVTALNGKVTETKETVDSATNKVVVIDGRLTTAEDKITVVQTDVAQARTVADTANVKANAVADKIGNVGEGTVKEYVDTTAAAKVDGHIADVSAYIETTGGVPFSEHPIKVTIPADGQLSPSGEWPMGKPVFVTVIPTGNYSLSDNLRMLGYGSLPTSAFHGTVFKVGDSWKLNVLVVE